jgi:hypothetical protein
MAEPRSSKPMTRVRFPPPAPSSLRLVARIALFQSAEDGSKPSGSAITAGSFHGRTTRFERVQRMFRRSGHRFADKNMRHSRTLEHVPPQLERDMLYRVRVFTRFQPLGLVGEDRGLISPAGWIVASTSDHACIAQWQSAALWPRIPWFDPTCRYQYRRGLVAGPRSPKPKTGVRSLRRCQLWTFALSTTVTAA